MLKYIHLPAPRADSSTGAIYIYSIRHARVDDAKARHSCGGETTTLMLLMLQLLRLETLLRHERERERALRTTHIALVGPAYFGTSPIQVVCFGDML